MIVHWIGKFGFVSFGYVKAVFVGQRSYFANNGILWGGAHSLKYISSIVLLMMEASQIIARWVLEYT